MFTALYELFAGTNDDPVYASEVYPTVGLFTLVFAIAFAILFYLLLGRWKPVWDKKVHWIVTLVLLCGIAVYLALSESKSATGEEYDSFMYKFALINSLIMVVYFFVFSLLLRKASIFARHTPF